VLPPEFEQLGNVRGFEGMLACTMPDRADEQDRTLQRQVAWGPDAKMELRQRRPDAHHPFFVKTDVLVVVLAELVRVQPTEFEFRVRGDATI